MGGFAAFWAAPLLMGLAFAAAAFLRFGFQDRDVKGYFLINLACACLWLLMFSMLHYVRD